MTYGDVVLQYRTEHNMSQRTFAAKCGLSNSYIAFLENNRNPTTGKEIKPNIETLSALANAMEMDLGDFLSMVDGNSQVVINTTEWDPDSMAWAEHADDTTRILARGMSKLSPENRQKLLDMARLMFADDFDEEGNKQQ